jgi:hypothetical protein
LPVSAGDLRGYGEEEFVDAPVRHESAEQGRAAFMPVTFQDDQQHVNSWMVYRKELARLKTGKHSLHM